jgi:Ca2+-binding EF-hand superfamily protein
VWGEDARFPRRKRSRSWANLELLAAAQWERRGAYGKPPRVTSTLLAVPDELSRCEKLLGRDEVDKLRRAFDRADVGREGLIAVSDVLVAFTQLGRRALKADLNQWLASRPLPSQRQNLLTTGGGRGGVNSSLDFLGFVKAFAGVFYGAPEDMPPSAHRDAATLLAPSMSSAATMTDAHGRMSLLMQSTMAAAGGATSSSLAFGGGDAAEVERWSQKLGRKQMGALEEVFHARATPVRRADGEAVLSRLGLRVRDLRPSLVDLGYDVSPAALTSWLSALDLKPGDSLSLGEFAYAFFSLLIDQDGRMPEFGYSGPNWRSGGGGGGDAASLAFRRSAHDNGPLLGAGGGPRRLDGGLLPIAEVASLVFQEDAFSGTKEQHSHLVRRCAIGRPDAQVSLLNRARDVFDALDKSDDGEIGVGEVKAWLGELGLLGQIQSSSSSSSSQKQQQKKSSVDVILETFVGAGDSKAGATTATTTSSKRATAFLPELLALFGYLFEGAGAEHKPSVATSFAMLRLHASQTDVKVCAETVLRYLDNLLRTPRDPRLWKVASGNQAFQARVGRLKGGPQLMAAVGFCEVSSSSSGGCGGGGGGGAEEWLVLEGTSTATTAAGAAKGRNKGSGGGLKALPPAQLALLGAKRSEVEAELAALEGAPSVAAALRSLRSAGGGGSEGQGKGASVREARAAADTALVCVVNVLRNPKDARVFRVKVANPRFHQTVGRLSGGVAVMEAVGFVLVEGGKTLELRMLGPAAASAAAASSPQAVDSASKFKFPSLDPETEAFLYRRKADLEAALLDLDQDPELSHGMSHDEPGRAQHDMKDAAPNGYHSGGGRGGGHRLGGGGTGGAVSTSRLVDGSGREGAAAGGGGGGKKKTTSSSSPSEAKEEHNEKLAKQVAGFMAGRTEAAAQQLAMLRVAFESLDANQDGFVDPKDLEKVWRTAGKQANLKKATEWVRARDADGDDRVAFDEVKEKRDREGGVLYMFFF